MNLSTSKAISPWYFTLFRISLGLYLICHFLQLLPWGTELFSNTGLIPSAELNPTSGLFVSPLNVLDSPSMVTTLIGFAIGASVLFMLGWQRFWMAILLWFIWSALFHRNNLISNPSIPYIGLLLWLAAIVPSGEPLAWRQPRASNWQMPLWVWRAAAWLLAAGYTFSGWTKLVSPSWLDGSAIAHVLNNPLARPSFARDALLALPEQALMAATWGALLAELLYLPLMAFRKARPWVWFAMVLMHLSLILVIDFADLSIGMLLIHLFVFDPAWLPVRKPKTSEVLIGFDDDCLLCNRFVQFLTEEDREDVLRFTKLQDQLTAEEDLSTIVVQKDGKVFQRSSAVLVIGESLGGHWRALSMLGKLVPRIARDLAYRLVAKHRKCFFKTSGACVLLSPEFQKRLTNTPMLLKAEPTRLTSPLTKVVRFSLFLIFGLTLAYQPAQSAWFPFTLMERPPGGNHLESASKAAFRVIGEHAPRDQADMAPWCRELRPGDLIAFQMPLKQRWQHFTKGQIKKVPYELFHYGHLAMVVEPPEGEQGLRLLQLAMAQAINTTDTFTYLHDKWWVAYRPLGEINETRLREFVATALTRGADKKKAYHYTGALGLWNVCVTPDHQDEIATQYTCATLLLAAYHYAGFPIKGINRGGFLDIVTPAQVVHSRRTSR